MRQQRVERELRGLHDTVTTAGDGETAICRHWIRVTQTGKENAPLEALTRIPASKKRMLVACQDASDVSTSC